MALFNNGSEKKKKNGSVDRRPSSINASLLVKTRYLLFLKCFYQIYASHDHPWFGYLTKPGLDEELAAYMSHQRSCGGSWLQ